MAVQQVLQMGIPFVIKTLLLMADQKILQVETLVV